MKQMDLRSNNVVGNSDYDHVSKRRLTLEVSIWEHVLPLLRNRYPDVTVETILNKFEIFKESLDLYFKQKYISVPLPATQIKQGDFFISGDRCYLAARDFVVINRTTLVIVPEKLTKKWFTALSTVYAQRGTLYGFEKNDDDCIDVYMCSDGE